MLKAKGDFGNNYIFILILQSACDEVHRRVEYVIERSSGVWREIKIDLYEPKTDLYSEREVLLVFKEIEYI